MLINSPAKLECHTKPAGSCGQRRPAESASIQSRNSARPLGSSQVNSFTIQRMTGPCVEANRVTRTTCSSSSSELLEMTNALISGDRAEGTRCQGPPESDSHNET